MRKFLAVTKREYKKVVFTWTFLIGTLLAPLLASMFAIVPMLIFSIKGDAVRLAVVDPTGKIAARLKENLSAELMEEKARQAMSDSTQDLNQTQEQKMKQGAQQIGGSFIFEDYRPEEIPLEQIRRELNYRIQQDQLDAYLIIPKDFDSADTKFEFYSRNSGDFVANSTLEDALNDVVRSERLAKANISESRLKELSQKIELDVTKVSEKGEEKDEGGGLGAAFIIGFLIYITLVIYGQAIMGAIVEEKKHVLPKFCFRPLNLLS